ncbi:MAG: bifunctional chorismate mutase/prephenate dehydrogenase [Verrucomicrobiae bacterium]|nr:bifunctional chorismate mutase/prephenate dehydrogenase [Verrucomicrobiae bacterium]
MRETPEHDHSPRGDRSDAAAACQVRNLEVLRREIDAIDEQIVNLLARRHETVQKVVSIKKAMGLPVWHPAREEDLVSQRRTQAARVGLDPAFVEEIFRCVLRQSRVRQTSHVARVAVRPGYRVLIVGGRGKMGEYFGRWFREAGYEVRVLDVGDWPHVDELCKGIHLALVSVPIDCTIDVIKKLGPHLPQDCVLADITSLKAGPVAAMLEAHSGPVVGLHPLFGPSTTVMDQQIVVSSPGRDPAACQWVLDQFSVWGNIVLTLPADEHDELMDIMQGVRHFATFAFGRFLAERNVSLSKTLEFCSPIYRLELAMVGRLFAQDARLYAGIILASAERRRLLKEFVDSLEKSRMLLEEGGMDAFCTEFARIAEWFGPFCEQAMRESSFLIDKLVERF